MVAIARPKLIKELNIKSISVNLLFRSHLGFALDDS